MKLLLKGAIKPEARFTKSERERYGSYDNYKARFIAACEALGAAMAREHHTIMVGVPDWQDLKQGTTVASYAILGASKATEMADPDDTTHVIVFYIPQDDEPADNTLEADSIRELDNLPHIDIEPRYLGRGRWRSAMIPDVAEADAVILLAGGELTASIGYAAYSLDKPVVAVTWLDGAAADISDHLLFNDLTRNQARLKIGHDELRSLKAEWFPVEDVSTIQDDKAREAAKSKANENRQNAENVICIATRLVNAAKLADRRALRTVWMTVAYMIACVFLWVWIFLERPLMSRDAAFFALLFVASILGTGLRTLVLFQKQKIINITALAMLIDITIALVLAFGLSLIYLIGGISFTGKVVVLTAETASVDVDAENLNTFASIATTMSVLGLAAGYLKPLSQLQEYLEKVIGNNDGNK
ncbi:MAG: hypothetical protein JXQ72_11135 [Anaerolineae bacterium]|nr:hypothetical protein [Anaerolineae bacterium]